MEATRMKEGIPLVNDVVKDLETLATKFNLSI
jgi:LDH2 family malate/lactate/ureidoglycolate dehydrogenase